jgi:tetratricopeptide (TPR) repeat protein
MLKSQPFLVACLLLAFALPARSNPAEFATASAAYRAKNYQESAKQFLDILAREPNNASAAYYAGYSLYGAGKLDEARNILWYLAKQIPTAREAFAARTFLKTIDPNFVKDAQNSAIGILPPTAPHVIEVVPIDKNKLVADIFETTPRRSKLDLDPNFVDQIKDALKAYPANILSFLHRHNCKIIVTPSVIETDFRMQNYHPGGYTEDALMDNVPALFNGTSIVIAEYAKNRNGDFVENIGVIGSLRHETGHAIDRYLGQLTDQEEFKHQFAFDGKAQYRQKLDYFMRSPRECFAELCCFRLGGRTDDYRRANCELLNATYPLCGKLVDEALRKVY